MLLAPEDEAAPRAADDITGHYTPSGLWFHDDPDDDDGDDETDACPTPIVIVTPWGPGGDGDYDDDRRRSADRPHERVYCPCPPLEPYPDGWLPLNAWEELDYLAVLDPTCEVRGTAVWVPEAKLGLAFGTLTQSAMADATVFVRGAWFDLDPNKFTAAT